ncbi:cell wall-binding repeat-containing protein [Finegoldia magna]|uniref:cell wall-binding repeat-containing protein n=1 Tax=Finegoldia magna TaxID=1260 RepID=UPI0023A9E8F6|nr:cell wall-binding repeat-containing protein [Finegoldia magna]MCC2718103.1 cell wall-binding repeat-containing protein [Finegoldia magna]
MKPYSKKFLAGVLLFSLVLPSATTFATNQTDSTTYAKLQEQGVKADQEVKVIVETSDKAAIEREPNVKSARFSKAVKASEAEVKETSENIKTKLNKENVKVDKEDEFSAVITGFSAKVKAKDIDKLRKQPGVKKVTTQMKAERPKGGASPSLATAPGMIKADTLWDQYKLSGQGMLISIIDTGVDPNHKDMQLNSSDFQKYKNEDAVNKVITENGLKGKWFSNKIPYGYNYADESQEIRDSGIGGYHGMHVAGIVAANGDAKNGGVRGVAPNAQLLAMKVFSNDALVSTVYEEVWLKAIDDSVKLGADVLNMSLGMGSGYSRDGVSPTNEAFNKAKAAGVVCAVAMGNDRVTNWGGEGKTNLAINPDFGTTGHPAVADPSYAVASMENTNLRGRNVLVEETDIAISTGTAEGADEDTTTGYREYVHVGLGNSEKDDYKGQDVTGKIVLAQRGKASFNEKANLAKEKGAAGIIIYNTTDGNNLSFMSGMENKEFPSVFISYEAGQQLIKLLEEKPQQKINITKVQSVKNDKGGQMSEFSSWGITPDLRLKPDIAGVGGQIYSTINDNKYTMMSGTSMATPQVAGASALVMQRLYKDGFLKRTADGKPDPKQEYLTVLVMMNTATPVKDTEVDEASLYTPKQQGAGLVNLENVVKTNATVTATGGKDTKEDGKLELGEVGEQFNATFKLKNYSDKDITFTPKYISLRDEIKDGRYTEHSSVAKEQTLDPVTVKANSEETYTTTISTKGIDKNQFAQGYVMFESDTNPILSVPYTGFKGDWSQPQFLDNMPDFSDDVNYKPIVYPDGGIDKAGFMRRQEKGGWNYWNAWNVDGKPTVFVNSNKQEGMNVEVAPVITIMRNALDVKYDILDKDGKTLRNLFIDPILLKVNGLYKDNGKYNFEYIPGGAAWDFKDMNDKVVDEGQYIYQITGHVDYKNAKEQKYQYNILLDNTAPELSYKYDKENRTITVTAKDNLAGVFSVGYENTKTGEWYVQEVRKDDRFSDIDIVRDYSYTFKIAEGFDLANLSIYAWDNSRNVAGEGVDTGVTSNIEIKPIELKVNDPIPGLEQIKEHIVGLPKDAEVSILNDKNNIKSTENPGEFGIRVSVKIGDKETYYWIPVIVKGEVKPEEPEPEKPAEKDLTVYKLPVITVQNPDYYQAFGQYEDKENPESYKNIHVQGNVTHIDELNELTLTITKDGKKVEGTEVQKIKYKKEGDSDYSFDHELDISGLEDGFVYELQINAKGKNIQGHKFEDTIIRRIRKDYVAPTIEYTVEQKDEKSPMAKIKVKGHENMTYLEMYLNNSMLSRVDKTWDNFELKDGVDGEFEIEVPLEIGENKFQIKAYDDAGNETIEDVVINRKDPNAKDPVDTTDLLNNLLKAHSIVEVPEKYEVTDEQLAELKDLIEQARKAIAEQQPQDKVDEINNKLKEALANIKEKEAKKVDKKKLVGQKEDAEELLKKKDDYKLDEKQEKALQDLIQKAEDLVKKEDATQEEVDKLAKEIEAEIAKIKEAGKPGKEDPTTPDKPGKEDPTKPDKPGKEDPTKPDKPGKEDPTKPDKPGKEDPTKPDKPGKEDPTTPDKPGKEDPKDPGKDNPGTTPSNPGTTIPSVPGTTTPSTPAEQQKTTTRVAGADRIQTAVEVSKKYYESADTVIVANYEQFADSLSASALSKQLKAPILLVKKDQLDSVVAQEIKRLGAKNVIVIGGEKSVDKAKNSLSKYNLQTIAGSDRYETSAKIAQEIIKVTGTKKAVIASGEVFADALTVAPLANKNNMPILLVQPNNIPKATQEVLKQIEEVIIVGGEKTISKEVENKLPNPTRIAGANRYETAKKIYEYGFKDRKEVNIANGTTAADSLVIGSIDCPILLAEANEIPEATKQAFEEAKFEKVNVFGGENSISESVVKELIK